MALQSTSLVSHGVVETTPAQTYGSGKTILRIGNGGAGATGLLEALSNDYLTTRDHPGSIEWICNHSRNTQLALLHNHIDLALTYEREQEALAVSEGWSVTAGCVFHDHFCLAGPPHDPANVRSASTIVDALSRIAANKAFFHSRADSSATMWKEQSLWTQTGLRPWLDLEENTWYKTSLFNPAEALIKADAAGAYLLTDRSTLLRQTMLKTISNLTVFVEPREMEDVLMNSCYALYSPSSSKERAQEVQLLLGYLNSVRGQAVISNFGISEVGLPLFGDVGAGFVRSYLAGGRPSQGKWAIPGPVAHL